MYAYYWLSLVVTIVTCMIDPSWLMYSDCVFWLMYSIWCMMVDVLWLMCFDWCTMIDACMVVLGWYYMIDIWLIYVEILWIDGWCIYGSCMHEGHCMIDISWGIMSFEWSLWRIMLCIEMKSNRLLWPFWFLVILELLHITSLWLLH